MPSFSVAPRPSSISHAICAFTPFLALTCCTRNASFVAIPIAAVMIRNGAAAGPVVAYVSGWSLLALHRFIAWEIPMLGFKFAALRYAACIVLPPLAGLIARVLVENGQLVQAGEPLVIVTPGARPEGEQPA